jgi:hypothetical protein
LIHGTHKIDTDSGLEVVDKKNENSNKASPGKEKEVGVKFRIRANERQVIACLGDDGNLGSPKCNQHKGQNTFCDGTHN